jgi:membrane protease YdiL (CAAX protease family)
MDIILNFLFITFFILVANLITRSGDNSLRRLFDGFLMVVSALLLLGGFFFVLVPEEQLTGLTAVTGEPLFPFAIQFMALGVGLQIIGVWGLIVSLRSTRAQLSRYLPVDPDSAVHTLALVSAGWLAGGTLIQLTQSSVEQIIEAIGVLTVPLIVAQGLAFALLGILGVGLFIRRNWVETRERLGLKSVTRWQLLEGVGWVLALVALQAMMSGLWLLIDPTQAEQVGNLNLELQSGLDTFWEWLILAIATGVGEEILFRGALQPVLGWLPTAVLFALVHVQYGLFTPATLAVLLVGLALGFIRRRHNTTLAIFVHAGYNFVLGMTALVASG